MVKLDYIEGRGKRDFSGFVLQEHLKGTVVFWIKHIAARGDDYEYWKFMLNSNFKKNRGLLDSDRRVVRYSKEDLVWMVLPLNMSAVLAALCKKIQLNNITFAAMANLGRLKIQCPQI